MLNEPKTDKSAPPAKSDPAGPPEYKNTPAILLDCEQRYAEGVLYSLAKHGVEVLGLSAQRTPTITRSRYLKGFYETPTLEEDFDQYYRFLLSLSRRGVLIPSGDICSRFLSYYQHDLRRAGYLLSSPEPEDFEALFDKWKCNAVCKDNRVPVAETHLVGDVSEAIRKAARLTFPVILKPSTLAGGGYVKVGTSDGIKAAFDTIHMETRSKSGLTNSPAVLIQEWVQSRMKDNWSCDVLVGQDGRLIDAVTIRRIRTSLNKQGDPTSRMYAGKLEENTPLTERTYALLRSRNWRGFAHVEYIYSEELDEYLLTEVNPRLPGYSYCLSCSGHEQALYYYLDLVGASTTQRDDHTRSAFYFEALRYPGDITDGVVNAWHGFIPWSTIAQSYWQAFVSKEPVIIEHYNRKDLRLTLAVQVNNVRDFCRKVVRYVRRRLNAIVFS